MDKLIELNKIWHEYEGTFVLENATTDIMRGEFVAIIGPNGSGKTTLMKIALGLIQPKKGEVKLYGEKPSLKKFGNLIGYIPQSNTIDKNFPATVREILSFKKEKSISDFMKVEHFIDKKFADLSGGQKQRVLITLALSEKVEILVLDEPTVGVDIKTQQAFYETLKKINKEKNITIVMITHDVSVISEYVERIICVNKNHTCSGKPEELGQMLEEIYGEKIKVYHHHD